MLNHIDVMGRLVRDPEYRTTGSGISVVSFTIAVDRDYASGENAQKETDFIDCEAWRKTAEFITKYFTKGRMIAVSGRLQIKQWTDKDGNKRRNTVVNVDNAYFGDSKKDSQPASQSTGYATGYPETEEALNRYGQYNTYPAQVMPGNEYPELTGEDGQLPF